MCRTQSGCCPEQRIVNPPWKHTRDQTSIAENVCEGYLEIKPRRVTVVFSSQALYRRTLSCRVIFVRHCPRVRRRPVRAFVVRRTRGLSTAVFVGRRKHGAGPVRYRCRRSEERPHKRAWRPKGIRVGRAVFVDHDLFGEIAVLRPFDRFKAVFRTTLRGIISENGTPVTH